MQPEIMILDEPTSQLDPEGTEEVFRVVEQLSKTGKDDHYGGTEAGKDGKIL